MNKSELSAALSTKTGLSTAQAAQVVSAIFDGEAGIIAATLSAGQEVNLQGFGTFKVKARAARVATNPATGGKINVPEKKAATFKAGKNLTASVA
jgi:DNA-binding protein HU-beta